MLALALVIDVLAVFQELADQPLWFRAAVLGLLPLQALVGSFLGMLTWNLQSR